MSKPDEHTPENAETPEAAEELTVQDLDEIAGGIRTRYVEMDPKLTEIPKKRLDGFTIDKLGL